jgi:chromate reductase, NAD(P)H dehydrogenase (quinone)
VTEPRSPSPIRVLGFAGSLRQGSYNRALLRAAKELAPAGMIIDVFDLAPIPLYNGDVEAKGDPAPVASFKLAIKQADAVLMVTPEYNHGVPGVMKNALDWASRPPTGAVLSGKPVAIMGASLGMIGTARAQYHLRQCFVFLSCFALNQPEVIVPFAQEKVDKDGKVTDQKTREKISELVEGLVAWSRRLTPST